MMQTVWGWQPALYLFLGGMGGGCFLTAAILYLKDAAHNRRTVCASMWAATISLAVGLLLLLAELITPVRGLMMWQSFSHFTSWMTFGAWGAFAAIVVFGLSAIFATEKVKVPANARRMLAIIGIVLGAFVAVYTGMLLMAPASVPFWNTPLLPLLFTVSAFDTGVALVEVMAMVAARKDPLAADAKRFLERCVVVLVLVEMVVLAAFLVAALAGSGLDAEGATAAASASMLVEGPLAGWFWVLLVAAGLALPLAVAIAGLAKSGRDEASESTPLTATNSAAATNPVAAPDPLGYSSRRQGEHRRCTLGSASKPGRRGHRSCCRRSVTGNEAHRAFPLAAPRGRLRGFGRWLRPALPGAGRRRARKLGGRHHHRVDRLVLRFPTRQKHRQQHPRDRSRATSGRGPGAIFVWFDPPAAKLPPKPASPRPPWTRLAVGYMAIITMAFFGPILVKIGSWVRRPNA